MVSHIKLIENRYSCKVSSLLRRPLHGDFSTFWQEETFAGNKVTSQCNGRNSSWPSDIVQQKRAFDRKRFCKLTKISDSLIIKIKNNFCWKIHQYFIRSKRYKVPRFLSFCKLIFWKYDSAHAHFGLHNWQSQSQWKIPFWAGLD